MLLSELRLSKGIAADVLAMELEWDLDDFTSLESDALALLENLELHQWTRLASALEMRLADLLVALDYCDKLESKEAETFQGFRDQIGNAVSRGMGIDALEEKSGWEIRSFLKAPQDGWNRKLSFFRDIGNVIGVDWRKLLNSYG